MKPTLIALLAAIALFSVAFVAFGADSGGVASLEGTGAPLGMNAASAAADQLAEGEGPLIAYARCLRDQGFDVDDPQVTDHDEKDFLKALAFDDPAALEALEACDDEFGWSDKKGDKHFEKKADWKRMSPEDQEAAIQAALDAGEITQEEADKKRAGCAESDKRFEKKADWKPMSPEDQEAATQAALDAGEIT